MKVLGMAACVLALAASAVAAPITYVHTGYGSGTLGGVGFGAAAPVAFSITAVGDTDNREQVGDNVWYIDNDSASIQIQGVGTFDFVTATRYFLNYGGSDLVGFSRAGSSGSDLYNGPIVGTWDMLTSIGPVEGSGHLLQWDVSGGIETTGGILSFTDAGGVAATFTATVGDVPPQVPEPASLLLLGVGLLLGGVRMRRR